MDKWRSKDWIARYVRANEANRKQYQLILIHAEDDYDVPSHHTEVVFWHAVNATVNRGFSYTELDEAKYKLLKTNLGAAGSVMEWRTAIGVIRGEILKTGLHDVVMGNPVITMAVMRIYEAANTLIVVHEVFQHDERLCRDRRSQTNDAER